MNYKPKRLIEWQDKMKKRGMTVDQMIEADRYQHIKLKQSYGLEHLHFYEDARGRYCCKYIPDPEVFDYDGALNNIELRFLLNSLSIQQGKVYFEDYGKTCTGIDNLKRLYLPMKLAGL